MSISLLEPLPCGNAIRVFVNPDPGAVFWRVLRRTADVFTGPDDSGAVVVADQSTDNVTLDLKALVNGTPYFYRLYWWDGAAWNATASISATPAASYAGDAIDPLAIVRERLDLGLQAEVAAGRLQPQSGAIPVLKSPYVVSDQVSFPTVFCHLDSFAPAERFLGEDIEPPDHPSGQPWSLFQGFLARNQINIGGVSRLPDERNALRRALTRILQANLEVFAGLGLNLVEFSFGDREELQENSAPLFITGGTFSCIAPSFVVGQVPEITDVDATPNASPVLITRSLP